MNVNTVSLAYCYGCRNAGDFAINEGTLALLERTIPKLSVQGVSRFSDSSEEYKEIVRKLEHYDHLLGLHGGPITYDPKSQSFRKQMAALLSNGLTYGFDLASIAPRSRLHSDLYSQIIESDFFLYNGGNAIHYSSDHQSLPYLLAVLYPLQIARKNNIPYGLLPQTIFGLKGMGEKLVMPILEDAEFIMTRDEVTYQMLSQLNIETEVVPGIDTAFLSGAPSSKRRDNDGTTRIAVVPRFSTLGDTGSLDARSSQMETRFITYLESLVNEYDDVYITIQTRMDERWVNKKKDRLEEIGLSFYTSFDPVDLRAHYTDMDLLVTMRLHAGIFALSVGTPAIGIYKSEWGPKIQGTWESLNISEFAISWGDYNHDHLRQLTQTALTNREELSNDILDQVSDYNEYLVESLELLISLPPDQL